MDLATLKWNNLTAQVWGDVPVARYLHVFTLGSGFLYVLGSLSLLNGKLLVSDETEVKL